MRKLFLAGSALVAGSLSALAADMSVKAPAPSPVSQLQTSGYVEFSAGGSWLDNVIVNSPAIFRTGSTTRYDGWPIGGAGRANWWATKNFSIQLDAQAEGTQYTVPRDLLFFDPTLTSKFSTLSYLVGGHANWRDPQTGLFGVFASVGDVIGNRDTNGVFGSSAGVRHALGGVEGQLYWNALTLYGQGGYDSTLDFGNSANVTDVHAWFARGTARYFFMPNFMMEATGQYSKGAMHFTQFPGFNPPDTGFSMWKAVAKAEWRPDTMPFSIFGKYEYNETRYDENLIRFTAGQRISENRVTAGVRLYLGPNSLIANDRTGATLDILDPLGASTSPVMFGQSQNLLLVSDIRLKRDIHMVGRLANGLGLYRYRYLWSDAEFVGVMAQEVALVQPKAVVHGLDGYLRVNYALLGIPFLTINEWTSAVGHAPL
jgi:hypothetical protein